MSPLRTIRLFASAARRWASDRLKSAIARVLAAWAVACACCACCAFGFELTANMPASTANTNAVTPTAVISRLRICKRVAACFSVSANFCAVSNAR